MAVGAPATLLPITTATAPAACALRIFTEKAQTPRGSRAILPVSEPAGRSVEGQALFRPLMPLPATTARETVRSDETVGKLPATAPNVWPPTVTGVISAWPTVAAPAVSARSARPG